MLDRRDELIHKARADAVVRKALDDLNAADVNPPLEKETLPAH